MQGWRKTQEDYHFVRYDAAKKLSAYAVMDGHGGRQVSKFIKQKFWETLLDEPLYKQDKYEEALKETFKKMDELLKVDWNARQQKVSEEAKNFNKIADQLIDKDEPQIEKLNECNEYRKPKTDQQRYNDKHHWSPNDVGSTLTVVLVTERKIICANVGDSRAVLANSSDTLNKLDKLKQFIED